MTKIYYKVLTSARKSASLLENHGFSTYYPVRKWTRAKVRGTPLFVFDNLEDAKFFAGGDSKLIKRCYIKKSRSKYLGRLAGFGCVWPAVNPTAAGWRKQWKKDLKEGICLTPIKGTVFASQVFCVE